MRIGFCKEPYSAPLRQRFWLAAAIGAPAGPDSEVEILNAHEVPSVLRKLDCHQLELIAIVDLATGLRRGELLALAWNNVDLDDARLRVERSLEETRAGLRFKTPKTNVGADPFHCRLAPSPLSVSIDANNLNCGWRLAWAGRKRALWCFATPTDRQCRPTNLAGTGGEHARRWVYHRRSTPCGIPT